MLYAEDDKTLAGVATFLSDPQRTIQQTLQAMMRTPLGEAGPHPVVASAARELLKRAEMIVNRRHSESISNLKHELYSAVRQHRPLPSLDALAHVVGFPMRTGAA